MGHIYALSGCSGVGKTTFLNALFATAPSNLRLLSRTTSRHRRTNEVEGVGYYYLPQKDFLLKIFANDFVHIEEYENNYYGIEAETILDTINSDEDGIIMAGVFGASKLKAVYGNHVSIVFMHAGTKDSLRDSRCLSEDFEPPLELKRRLNLKIEGRTFNAEEYNQTTIDNFIRRRMELSYLEIAFVNGRIRSREQICILENLRDKMENAFYKFNEIRNSALKSPSGPFNELEVEISKIRELSILEKQHILGERDRLAAIQENLKRHVIKRLVTKHMMRRKVMACFALALAVCLFGIIFLSLFFIGAEWNLVSIYLIHGLEEWSKGRQDIAKEAINNWVISIITFSISFLCVTIVWQRLLNKKLIKEAQDKLWVKYTEEIDKLSIPSSSSQ